jgi:hypothetical protein
MIYECKDCNYSTKINSSILQHYTTKKHKSNVSTVEETVKPESIKPETQEVKPETEEVKPETEEVKVKVVKKEKEEKKNKVKDIKKKDVEEKKEINSKEGQCQEGGGDEEEEEDSELTNMLIHYISKMVVANISYIEYQKREELKEMYVQTIKSIEEKYDIYFQELKTNYDVHRMILMEKIRMCEEKAEAEKAKMKAEVEKEKAGKEKKNKK